MIFLLIMILVVVAVIFFRKRRKQQNEASMQNAKQYLPKLKATVESDYKNITVAIDYDKSNFDITILNRDDVNELYQDLNNTNKNWLHRLKVMSSQSNNQDINNFKFNLINSITGLNFFSVKNGDVIENHMKKSPALNKSYIDSVEITLANNANGGIGAYQKDQEMYLYNDQSVAFKQTSDPHARYFITNVSFTPDIETTYTTKGRAGSALVGGIIAGPIGAAVGASRKRQTTQKNEEYDSIMYVSLITRDEKHSTVLPIIGNTHLAQSFSAWIKH